MSHEQSAAAAAPPLSLTNGILLLILIVAGIVGWIALGTVYLALKSFFASFLFGWYWATHEHAAFERIPACVIGALVGVGLAWTLKAFPVLFPAWGLWAAVALVVVALFLQIMNWVPLVVNANSMLFLTVLAAPALLTNLDLVEVTKAIVGGAAFFAVLAYFATLYARMMAARAAG